MKQTTITFSVSIVVSSDQDGQVMRDSVDSSMAFAAGVIEHYLSNCGLEVNEVNVEREHELSINLKSG